MVSLSTKTSLTSILQSITPGMTRIMHRAGIGVTHGAGVGLSEFPSDLADAGTAGSTAAFSIQAFDASALVTLACSIRGSDASAFSIQGFLASALVNLAWSIRGSEASALPMRVLAVSAAAVADSMINMAGPTGRSAAEEMIELSLMRAPPSARI